MKLRVLLGVLCLMTIATTLEAGPVRRRVRSASQYPIQQIPADVRVVSTDSSLDVVPASAGSTMPAGSGDGLDEVNAQRAARGLRPYVRDEGLTQAAQKCAAFRAERGLFG